MARDDEKKTTGRGRKKSEEAEPKKGTRAKTGTARTTKGTSAKTARAPKGASTATSEAPKGKAGAEKPKAARPSQSRATKPGASRAGAAKNATSRAGTKSTGARARARKPDAAKRGRDTSMPTQPTERDFREPSHEEIARRAYQVWQETGNEDALENWMRAERELREGNRER